MSFSSILHTVLIKPIQLLFEIIYVTAERVTGNPGLAIIVLSLVINFLVLPLYLRADAMQKEERDIEKKLQKGVAHIKKTFRGNERMMMLQTYYRQNDYKPTHALRGAVSLFLQVPFFLAAYQFLSGLQSLNGVSFGPLKNLGEPDGLLLVGGYEINILPVIMTVVNLVSCMVFTKDSTTKSRIQLYAMAFLFYLILFDSPSGLVFYWTLNNVFSLVKTLLTSSHVFKHKRKFCLSAKAGTADTKIFFAGTFYLAVLLGLLIPSAVIASSPQEFIILNYFYTPLELAGFAFCFAVGVFCLWLGIFYWLAKPSVKILFDRVVWILSGAMTVNYMFFGKHLGILTPGLRYETGLRFGMGELFGNAVVLLVVIAVFYFLALYWKKHLFQTLAAGCIALCCMSGINAKKINDSVAGIRQQGLDKQTEETSFSLSKQGKNVIVLVLDRAMGLYVPYIFNEKPDLKEQFSGFTYYSNVISYGRATNFGAPVLFGGYEYTPEEMNKRSDEPLVNKHNEALKLMPALFDENDYEVTVCDPPYANYQWVSDLSIYDEYPDIKTHITIAGEFSDLVGKKRLLQSNRRNFFCFSLMKSMPLMLQKLFYDNGAYLQADKGRSAVDTDDISGLSDGWTFLDNYRVLSNLSSMTNVLDDGTDTFLLMTNNLTHHPELLQEPEYTPADDVDNSEFEKNHKDRFELNGQKLNMEGDAELSHYQTNMAAMIQLGKWFDYMRENNVYDNTRIILVSDHGHGLYCLDSLVMGEVDLNSFYPLLMVKDFDGKGFVTSEEFMTNGDVPTIAMDGLIRNPVNPFTGNKINSEAKKADKQYILYSYDWDVETNNGNTFCPGIWFSVHDDMRDKNNWEQGKEASVLPDK